MNKTITFTEFMNLFKNNNNNTETNNDNNNKELITTIISLSTPFLLLIALALYFVFYCYKQTIKFMTIGRI